MYQRFEQEINSILISNQVMNSITLLKPPTVELGDFCVVVNKIAEKNDPKQFAQNLIPKFKTITGIENISIVETAGKKKRSGIVYLNFTIVDEIKTELQIKYLKETFRVINSNKFAMLDSGEGKNAIVEHTSANPISPLHVGNLRNSVHGDTLARILSRLGYNVIRHFYVNDVGLQVAFVAVGFEIVKKEKLKPEIKFDLWLGRIYAIMHNLYYLRLLKEKHPSILDLDNYYLNDEEIILLDHFYDQQISEIATAIKSLEQLEKLAKSQKKELKEKKRTFVQLKNKKIEIRGLKLNFESLKSRFTELHSTILQNVHKIDLLDTTADYLIAYEKNSDPKIVALFRELTDWILETFKWTLGRFNIDFDIFDYESELTWSGKPRKILDQLSETSNAKKGNGKAVRYTFPAKEVKLMYKELSFDIKSIPIRGDIPELQLQRADGTALYACKDIAYSIQKYESSNPELIFNVISSEQSLPQFQLLFPLFELGYKSVAKAMKHYSYELVELKGRPMSGRRAIYVTADEYYDETLIRARLAKRQSDAQRQIGIPNNLSEWKEEMDSLTKMTIASTRFPLIETSPTKKIILDLDRELDFKRNSGPFVQYAHARACGILRKYGDFDINDISNINFIKICDDPILELMQKIMEIHSKLEISIAQADPSIVANWVLTLAKLFMKFYEQYPILKLEDQELKEARIAIVKTVQTAIGVGLMILGIPPADRI